MVKLFQIKTILFPRPACGERGVLFFLFLCILSFPALAADDTAAKRSDILRLFEVQPPRAMIDAAIEAIANKRFRANDPARDEFVSRLQVVVDYDAVEQTATKAMMDLYTAPELRAMADYYTSDVGRAAEAKAPALRARIAPTLKEMLDKSVLNVVTSPSPAESAGQK